MRVKIPDYIRNNDIFYAEVDDIYYKRPLPIDFDTVQKPLQTNYVAVVPVYNGFYKAAEPFSASDYRKRGKQQRLWLSKKSFKRPTVVVRFGACDNNITGGQTVIWDKTIVDFTNADEKSLGLIAANLCTLTGIGSYA